MKIIKKRIEKHYQPTNKNWHWHLLVDSLLMFAVVLLIATNLYISTIDAGSVLGTQDNTPNAEQPNEDTNNQDLDNGTKTTTSTPAKQDNDDKTEKPIVIKNTNITLTSFARYYTAEGEQLGIGPIPPVVNQSTTYRVFISISDFTHDLENVVVSATLPRNVTHTGQPIVILGDDISIDGNKILWALGDLTTEDHLQLARATFKLTITPTPDQLNQIALLLKNISITATDIVTGRNIKKINDNITTNLTTDKLITDSGLISAE